MRSAHLNTLFLTGLGLVGVQQVAAHLAGPDSFHGKLPPHHHFHRPSSRSQQDEGAFAVAMVEICWVDAGELTCIRACLPPLFLLSLDFCTAASGAIQVSSPSASCLKTPFSARMCFPSMAFASAITQTMVGDFFGLLNLSTCALRRRAVC